MQIEQNSRLYSIRQLLIATVMAGPLAGFLMAARNNKITGNAKTSRRLQTIGITLTLLVILVILILLETLFKTHETHQDISQYGTLGIFFSFLLFYSLIAYLFYLKRSAWSGLKKAEKLPETFHYFSSWKIGPYLLAGWVVTFYLVSGGPFWFTFNVIYLLPNIYLYNHIKKIFTKPIHRRVFALLFVVLVIMFPLGESLEHSDFYGLPGFILTIGYYYLPILLYSFLLYLVFDLLKLINKLFHLIPRKSISSGKSRFVVMFIILGISGAITGSGIYWFNNTHINSYTIEVPAEESGLDELTIALAADFHLGDRTSDSFVRQFVEKVNAIEPDVILLAGDIIENMPGERKRQVMQDQLNQLKSTYGIFAVEGNHELYGNNGKLSFFENTSIKFLKDTIQKIDDSFYLAGRKDRHNRHRKSLEELLNAKNTQLPVILMDHQPYELEKASRHDIDIQVSGHTHHGQLFPFQWITEAIYRVSWGHEKINNTHFFVTCGAQGWGPPVKTSSKSEVMKIEVKFLKQ